MSILEHALVELKLAGYLPLTEDLEDGPNKWIQQDVLAILEATANQGHSKASLEFMVGMYNQLVRQLPLTPLTGADEEWEKAESDDPAKELYQNVRCGRVFKAIKGEEVAYVDVEGRLFVDPKGSVFRNQHSVVAVTLPYMPSTEYVKIDSTPEVAPVAEVQPEGLAVAPE